MGQLKNGNLVGNVVIELVDLFVVLFVLHNKQSDLMVYEPSQDDS